MAITQPRYAQVADVLRDRINAGTYEPGDQLPSQRELREEFDISVPTAKAAISQLVSEGLVYAHQGRGVFVRETKELLRFAGGRYGLAGTPNAREEEASGIELDVRAEHRQVQATPEVAARLEIEPGDMCSEAVYSWYLDGEPVMISTQWEPLAMTRENRDRDARRRGARRTGRDHAVRQDRHHREEDPRGHPDPDADPGRGPHAQDPQRGAGLLHSAHSLRQTSRWKPRTSSCEGTRSSSVTNKPSPSNQTRRQGP